MRTQFKVLLTSSALLGGLLAAPVLYAQNADNRGIIRSPGATSNQLAQGATMDHGMMGQGMMGPGMMEQMTRMMENCNKMMESAMAESGKRDTRQPSGSNEPTRR